MLRVLAQEEIHDADGDDEDAGGPVDDRELLEIEVMAQGVRAAGEDRPPQRGSEEDAAQQLGRQDRVAARGADTHRREDGREGDERHRIRQRQHERREEIPRETPPRQPRKLAVGGAVGLHGLRQQQPQSEQDQDAAADPLKPGALRGEKPRPIAAHFW